MLAMSPTNAAGRNAKNNISANRRASGLVRSPDGHVDDPLPVEPHHRQDRAELDHHGEDAAWVVVADGAPEKQQMRRG